MAGRGRTTRWRTVVPLLVFLALVLVPTVTGQDPTDEDRLRGEAESLRGLVQRATDGYVAAHGNWTAAANDTEREEARQEMVAAGRTVGDAFLAFETGHGDERSLNSFLQAKMPSNFYRTFERNVVLLRSLMLQADAGSPAGPSDVQAQSNLVTGALDRTIDCMPDGCGSRIGGAMVQSFVIILREGFEAILLVGAFVAYLRKTDHVDRIRYVLFGVGAAVVLTFVAWAAIELLFQAAASSGLAGRRTLEAISMLTAAAVLAYVSHWLLSKTEGRRWERFLDGRLAKGLTANRPWLLALIGFLAVFREGLETVLLLKAVAVESAGAGGQIVAGVLLGAVALAGIYVAFHRYGVRIPLRLFFGITSALLFLLALRFLGLGIFELQEAGTLAATPMAGTTGFLASHPLWSLLLVDVLGFAPTVEVAVAQTLFLLVMSASLAYFWLRRERATAVPSSP